MKTWKHSIFGILAIIALAFAINACDDGKNEPTDDPNEVKERTTTITVFGGSTTVTVKGVLTKPQLDNSANKIKSRLTTAYDKDIVDYGETVTFDYYKNTYATRGVIYIVEANPEGYTIFKIIGDGKTIYIALDKVDTEYVFGCIGGILNGTPSVSKAIDSSINKGVIIM